MRTPILLLLALTGLLSVLNPQHASAAVICEIGTPDNNNAEFALAPGNFKFFSADSCFVPGFSQSKTDWAYVHPGPADAWAGSRQHAFTIAFALKSAPQEGTCHFKIDLLDTHKTQPPRLRVIINGTRYERRLPAGGGDASVQGEPGKGREFIWDLPFPSSLLRPGENEISITTVSGSWVLYDFLSLEVPGDSELTPLPSSTGIIKAEIPPVWLREGSRALQPISLTLRHFGQGTPAQIRIDNTNVLADIQLKNGIQVVEARIAADERSRQIALSVVAGGLPVASTNLHLTPPRIRKMWLLPHSHVDIGYTHQQDEIIDVQIANLRNAMKLSLQTATNPPGMRFKWNPEAVWSLDHFLQRATPEEQREFVAAVKRGDVGVDGLYANILTGLCRPEELVQAMAFGARLSNLTGVPVRSASICDVPGWTWGIVPIMAHAGVKYFAIGPNFRDRVGTIHLWDNKPFYWKSQSGQERILCWVVDNYHFYGDLETHVLAQVNKLNTPAFPYDTSFMFWVGRSPNGAVDNAPPDEMTAEKALAWNAKYAAPQVIIGLVGDYFSAFEAKYGGQLAEFSGDLTPYWEDGAGSTSKETALNRRSADRLSQAETLQVMRSKHLQPGSGISPRTQSASWDAAWKNVLLYSEHTWGAWCSISAPDEPFTRDQWKVKQAFALDADLQSRELLTNSLPVEPLGGQEQIDVLNTTQYEHTGLAIVPLTAEANSVRDSRGRSVPTQRLASGELCFLAEGVPPFGARRYRLDHESPSAQGSAHAEAASIQNARVTVDVDTTTGAIRSLRFAGEEYVDGSAPVAINDFRYVLGTNTAGALKNGPVKITVIEPGPVVAMLRVESDAPGCNKLTREIRVVHGLDQVEVLNIVDRKAIREKDAVHFGYGFNVPGGQIRMETPWAVVRPNVDQLPGSCRNWFTVQRWVDISNDKTGVTWAPVDAPLMEIGGMTANLLGSVDFSEWLTNAPSSQTIYSWAQNNHWHTNYKVDQPGLTRFEYVLRPHQGGYSPAQAARFGMQTTRPLIVARAEGKESTTPLLTLNSPDVLVETVKPSTDGKAVILRLFGVGGKDATVRIQWRRESTPASLWLTDLTEKALQKVDEDIRVAAYAVVHLRAEIGQTKSLR